MKLKIGLVIAALGLIAFVPGAQAAPPTESCYANFYDAVLYQYGQGDLAFGASDYGTNNILYAGLNTYYPTESDKSSPIYAFNTNCTVRWAQSVGVADAGFPGVCPLAQADGHATACSFATVHYDRANRVSVSYTVTSSGYAASYIDAYNRDTGTLQARYNITEIVSPALETVAGLSSVYVDSDEIDYIISTDSQDKYFRIHPTSATAATLVWQVALTNPTNIQCCTEPGAEWGFVASTSGGTAFQTRFNVSTGAGASNTWATAQVTGDFQELKQGYADDTLFYGAISAGSGGTLGVGYNSVTWSTNTAIGAAAYTPSQIDPGAGSKVTVQYTADLDGADAQIVCGYYIDTEDRGFMELFQTSDGAQDWQILQDYDNLNPSQNNIQYCGIDYGGGIWSGMNYKFGGRDGVLIQRWEGGGTVAKLVRGDYASIAGSGGFGGTGALNPSNPIGQAVTYFNDAWGFDGSWLFGMLVVAICMFPFARRGVEPLVVALFALLGVGVALALGLFPIWLLFVLIFLIIAVAGHRLFNRAGGGEGGDGE